MLKLLVVLCAAAAQAALVAAPPRAIAAVSAASCSAAMPLAPMRPSRLADVVMAVPKKRQSKMKTRQRKANWFAKARRQAQLALSRAKSAGYKPLEDPKFVSTSADDDDDEDDE